LIDSLLDYILDFYCILTIRQILSFTLDYDWLSYPTGISVLLPTIVFRVENNAVKLTINLQRREDRWSFSRKIISFKRFTFWIDENDCENWIIKINKLRWKTNISRVFFVSHLLISGHVFYINLVYYWYF